MAGRLAASLKGISLIRVFLEQRLHRLAPVVEILLQQFLRRRDAARDRLFQWPQVTRLVAAVAVEPRPPLEAGRRQPQRLLRQREYVAAADLGAEAALRHLVAQGLALLRAPAFDHVAAGVERRLIVE